MCWLLLYGNSVCFILLKWVLICIYLLFIRKLNEVRKRLNELRELVHYYEQTSDMMTDAVNENTKEEETEESEYDSEHENSEPVTNIR